VIHRRLLRGVSEEVGWYCGCNVRQALGRGMKKMDGDHMGVDGVVGLVLVVCEMRTDAVPKGYGQVEFEIGPRTRSDFGFGLVDNCRPLLGIDH